jgi:arabinan endo-1,5-alpha-L-arabinosidase
LAKLPESRPAMVSRAKAVAPRLEQCECRSLLSGAAMASGVQGIASNLGPTASAAPEAAQVTGLSDPRIIQEDGAYYLFATGPGIPIRMSNDLVHWSQAGQVFADTPPWALAQVPRATMIWAPDISYYNGQYHLYYTVSTFGSQRSVIGLATNTTLDPTSPDYHWVDQGEVIASRPGRSNYNAIDPNLVVDPRSGVWLAFGSQWSGIKLVAIDPATGKPYHSHHRLITLAARPDAKPIEAPFIFQNNGYYYLFVSFDLCCMGSASTYKIMVGRSRAITGPYVDRHGRRMTEGGGTLVLSGDGRFRGPGHNAVLSSRGGDDLVYHAYDTQNGGIATLQIRPLSWSSTGWPVAGAPLF